MFDTVKNDTARYVDQGDAKRKRPFNKDSKHADIAEFLKLKNNHLETTEGKLQEIAAKFLALN